jgi:hypothetical protein
VAAFDLGHIAKLNVDAQETREYCFEDIRGRPTILVLPATRENKALRNAAMKIPLKAVRRIQSTGQLDGRFIDEVAARDLKLYPKYVVRGWGQRPPKERNGTPLPETEEAYAAFLEVLPFDMFEDLRQFCQNANNWREAEDEELDEEELADQGNA